MVDELVVRRARREDRSCLVVFHRELYVHHRGAIMDEALVPLFAYRDFERVLRDDVDALLANPGTLMLIAERSGVPVGYISGHVESDPRRLLSRKGIVEDWFVDEGARGRGTGRRLFDELVALFRGAGCELVESGTWPFNEGARRAHEALGFTETEVRYRMPLDP